MKIITEFPPKLKLELPYDPTLIHLGIYTKVTKKAFNRDNCILKFIVALITISKS
jgi:hypothetical protein